MLFVNFYQKIKKVQIQLIFNCFGFTKLGNILMNAKTSYQQVFCKLPKLKQKRDKIFIFKKMSQQVWQNF